MMRKWPDFISSLTTVPEAARFIGMTEHNTIFGNFITEYGCRPSGPMYSTNLKLVEYEANGRIK